MGCLLNQCLASRSYRHALCCRYLPNVSDCCDGETSLIRESDRWQRFPDNYFKPCWDIAMKKLALTVSILALGSVSAFAGDLPSRVANANAYMDPVYNWTGFYTGVNLGQSWGRSRSTTSFDNALSGAQLSGANP